MVRLVDKSHRAAAAALPHTVRVLERTLRKVRLAGLSLLRPRPLLSILHAPVCFKHQLANRL